MLTGAMISANSAGSSVIYPWPKRYGVAVSPITRSAGLIAVRSSISFRYDPSVFMGNEMAIMNRYAPSEIRRVSTDLKVEYSSIAF
jgi:hypothetical protein